MEGETAKVSPEKIRDTVEAAVNELGWVGPTTRDGWDCRREPRRGKECLEETRCEEALYLDIREEASSFSYTIVSLKRGKLANLTGGAESDLLNSIEEDINTLLKRPANYEYDQAEQELNRDRKRDLETVGTEGDHRDTRSSYQLFRGLTIAAATLTALSAGAAIGTGIAGQNKYDELDEMEPMERDKKDLDKARTLLYASRATMAVAIAFGVTTAVLAPFAIIKKKEKQAATLELTPTLTQNGGGLFLTSSF